MQQQEQLYSTVAPLANVHALASLIDRVQNRSYGLPGMATFYGPSGDGKTTAAVYSSIKFRAVNVQVKSCWSQKRLCQAILDELSVPRASRTISEMVDQISAALAMSEIPLLVDEADFLVKRRMIEILRDIHEGSGAAVILIGEELLPQKLQAWERIHGRMLDWVATQPGTLHDVKHLARIYASDVDIEEALQKRILDASNQSIRRICVNLSRIRELAQVNSLDRVTVEDWGDKPLFQGLAPAPRRALK